MEETEQSGDLKQVEQPKDEALHSAHYRPYSVLTVGTELAVLSPESPIHKRIFGYGKYFKEMHIVLLSGITGQGNTRAGNVTAYPTNSRSKLSRYFDALRIGKSISGIEIVSAQDPFETAIIAWLIARHHRAPLHVQVHTDFLSLAYARLSVVNFIRVRIAGFILHRASRIRVVSERVRASLETRYGLSSTVLPIYVDTHRFQHTNVSDELRVRFMSFSHRFLVVSRLEPEKNVMLALLSFAAVAPREACLIILGSGSELNALMRATTRHGLDNRVFFEGHQDPAPYYTFVDLVLFPSVYDGYGQVIVEALAAGKPVLATDVGIAREAGAIVTSPETFEKSLGGWIKDGPRSGQLTNYPYASAEDYEQKYATDIAASKGK